ncbi:hypothetical protein BEI_1865 [Halomonas beimenensis]|uniref:Uncharacterized protein n=1 Tax=Halomonas beimenensis TaxID=475662 RepID=A0A291P7L1_9GAMM|nr:hypothetical protein BEI_1865 [Halomonas beimenensis]
MAPAAGWHAPGGTSIVTATPGARGFIFKDSDLP